MSLSDWPEKTRGRSTRDPKILSSTDPPISIVSIVSIVKIVDQLLPLSQYTCSKTLHFPWYALCVVKRYEQKTFGNFFPPILNLTCAIHDVYIVFWVCILYVWVNGCPSQFTSTRMDQHIFVSVLQSFFAVSCFVIFLIILYLPNRFQSKEVKD